MSEKKVVSIIVPVYNVKKYLKECLNALLIQEGIIPYEVILIDDGSTDGCGKICDQYALKYPNIFKVIHQSNQGLPCARNAGLKICKGKWVTFVDSDDIPQSDFVLSMVHTISCKRQCDVAVMGYKLMNEQGKIKEGKSTRTGFLSGRQTASLILNDITVRGFVWNKIFRKSLIDKYNIKFYNHKAHFEDLPFSFSCLLMANEVVFSKKSCYIYRESRSGSITQSGMQGKRLQEHINSFFACRAFFDSQFGALNGAKFFAPKIKRIYVALIADIPGTIKNGNNGEEKNSFMEKLKFGYNSLTYLGNERIPVYGAPWEKNMLDYSGPLENYVKFVKEKKNK